MTEPDHNRMAGNCVYQSARATDDQVCRVRRCLEENPTEPQESPRESPRESDVVERARQAVDAWDRFAVWAPTRVPGVRVCLDLVRDLVAEVERLTAERDEARTEVERLEADLDGAAYRAGRKQGELAEARAAVERLRTDLARMTEQAEAAEVALADLVAEVEKLRAAIELDAQA